MAGRVGVSGCSGGGRGSIGGTTVEALIESNSKNAVQRAHFRSSTGQHLSGDGNIYGTNHGWNYGTLLASRTGTKNLFPQEGTFFGLAVSNRESPDVFKRLN